MQILWDGHLFTIYLVAWDRKKLICSKSWNPSHSSPPRGPAAPCPQVPRDRLPEAQLQRVPFTIWSCASAVALPLNPYKAAFLLLRVLQGGFYCLQLKNSRTPVFLTIAFYFLRLLPEELTTLFLKSTLSFPASLPLLLLILLSRIPSPFSIYPTLCVLQGPVHLPPCPWSLPSPSPLTLKHPQPSAQISLMARPQSTLQYRRVYAHLSSITELSTSWDQDHSHLCVTYHT